MSLALVLIRKNYMPSFFLPCTSFTFFQVFQPSPLVQCIQKLQLTVPDPHMDSEVFYDDDDDDDDIIWLVR